MIRTGGLWAFEGVFEPGVAGASAWGGAGLRACCNAFDETIEVGVTGAGPALAGDGLGLMVILGIIRLVTPYLASVYMTMMSIEIPLMD